MMHALKSLIVGEEITAIRKRLGARNLQPLFRCKRLAKNDSSSLMRVLALTMDGVFRSPEGCCERRA